MKKSASASPRLSLVVEVPVLFCLDLAREIRLRRTRRHGLVDEGGPGGGELEPGRGIGESVRGNAEDEECDCFHGAVGAGRGFSL
jgi:hypothetical protein